MIADDTALLREGVARLLTDAGFEVVGQCADADDLLLKVRSYSPDVAITDIRMPPTQTDEGLRAALEIRASYPKVGVLVLSQHADIGLAMKLLADNAEGVGYMLKTASATPTSLPKPCAGSGTAARSSTTIVSQLLGRRRGDDPVDALTPRERRCSS